MRVPSATDRHPDRTVHVREHLRAAVSAHRLAAVTTVHWRTPRALEELVGVGLACCSEAAEVRPALAVARRELWALLARMDRPANGEQVRCEFLLAFVSRACSVCANDCC